MTDLASLSSAIIMGILLGGLYALIALGLSLVFGLMRLINVAHGDLVMFSSYFAYALLTAWSLDPFISIFIGIPIWLLAGYGIQKYLMSRAFEISAESPLIIAFGISLILQNLAQIFWSPMSRSITTAYSLESISLGSVVIPTTYVFDFIAALIVMFKNKRFKHD